ncbi:MAG: DUF3987 domain-containing protein [Cyanobacteria bacterium P01_C01_bin.38]
MVCYVSTQTQQNNPQFKYPILFVKDSFLVTQDLKLLFDVREFYDVEDSADRPIYIFSDRETPEVAIRKLAWHLGEDVQIYSSQQPLEYLCSEGIQSAKELFNQIFEYSLSYSDWAARKETEALAIGEAQEIARAVYNSYKNSLLTRTELDGEIAKLSARIDDKASYQWSKFVRSLEAEFKKELIARGIVKEADLRKELTALTEVNDHLTREIQINQLAAAYGYPAKTIYKMLVELEKQLTLVEDAIDNRSEVENLLDLSNLQLDLSNFLPSKLAYPLKQYCQWLSIKEEVILLTLLTATSSLHEAGTTITLQKRQNFTVPPTIFAGIVAESGQKKSPITRQMITAPLAKLDSEVQAKYFEEKEQYETDLEEWEADKAAAKQNKQPFDEPKPEEPKPPSSFWFTNATGEGMKKEAQNYPDKILFGLVDELAGLFNAQNAYRGGKGSDRQELLSCYDGYRFNDLRSGQSRKGRAYLSLFGTIQPDVLKNIMRDCSDPDGQWSRFLFVQQPLVASELPDEEEGGIDITNLIAGIYRKLTLVPATEYRLSKEAFKLYQPWYNELEQKRVNDPIPGLRAAYSKAEGYTGRLALNLHVLHELSLGVTPSPEIPVERMREAIKIMKFFLGQTKRFYSQFDDGIAPQITKILELSNRKGWLKAKDVQLSYQTSYRPKPDTVRQWFIQASELGFGQIRGTGKKLEFLTSTQNQKVDKVDKSRQKVDDSRTAEQIDNTSVEKKVDTVDEKNKAFLNNSSALDNRSPVEEINPVIPKVEYESTSSIEEDNQPPPVEEISTVINYAEESLTDLTIEDNQPPPVEEISTVINYAEESLTEETVEDNQPLVEETNPVAQKVDILPSTESTKSTLCSKQDIEPDTTVEEPSTDNLLSSTESTDKTKPENDKIASTTEKPGVSDQKPQPATTSQATVLNKQPQSKTNFQAKKGNGVSSTEHKNKPTTQPKTKNQVNPSNGVANSTVPTSSQREKTIFPVENYSNETEKRDWDGTKHDSAWDDGSAFPR